MGIRNFRFPFIWVQHSFMDFSLSDFILFSFTKVLLYTRKKSKIRLLFMLCRRLHLLRATFFTFYSVSNVIHATLWLRVFNAFLLHHLSTTTPEKTATCSSSKKKRSKKKSKRTKKSRTKWKKNNITTT